MRDLLDYFVDGDTSMSLRAHQRYPLVLGRIGGSNESEAKPFFDQIEGARSIIRGDGFDIRCVGPVEERGADRYLWGRAVAAVDPPSGWREASEALCAAGIVSSDEGWVLFTDSLGIHPVYLRRVGGALYFATRLQPLVALSDPLRINWAAWADIFVMGAPLGSSTQYEEIERLEAATGLVFDEKGNTRRISFEPGWLSSSRSSAGPEALASSVREALPSRSLLRKPPGVTLSGGWDSRLVAGIAADVYLRRPRAWTTGQDDGRDLDLALAPAVAEVLGLPHEVVELPGGGWSDIAAETRSRVQYETWLHPWLTPLCRRMRMSEREVLDGLGGDVLIKGLFVDDEILAVGGDERLGRLYARLGGRRGRFEGHFRPGLVDGVLESCRQSFFRAAEPFAGHLNQPALSVLHTRTARVISLSPLCLFAPEIRVWLPFLHPRVLSQSLAIDPQDKTGGRLYRDVLGVGSPTAAKLPSTNDPISKSDPGPRLQSSREATEWMIESILTSDLALGLLDEPLRRELRDRGDSWMAPNFKTVRFLQVLSLFAQWERDKANWLAPSPPPF